ncbi:hypothetical protein OAG71_02895 [bacterium]|nr:hypothetical protein [bacterium]
MKKILWTAALALGMYHAGSADAQTTLQINSSDFGITSVFNDITSFNFEIELTDNVVAGETYDNPDINQVAYQVLGSLPQPTPSGFPAFTLTRSYSGTEFYNQSPESGLMFSVDANANLSDGLQYSELVGTGAADILIFNARELNQDPGRYHPPELVLRADGTGQLQNAANASTFSNPPPPMGSGMLIPDDFAAGDEYIVDLSFAPSATLAATAVPSPSSLCLLSLMSIGVASRRRRQ